MAAMHPPAAAEVDRRGFLGWFSGLAVVAALAGAYGTLASFFARFLYPAGPPAKAWLYVCELARLVPGESLTYLTPAGATVAVARRAAAPDVASFIALSSTCPHLGCQVHWEAQNNRFYCPCHGGAFEPGGKAIAGPPQKAGQSLSRYPLKVESGLIYIEVPLAGLASGTGREIPSRRAPGPGHDPCLEGRRT